MCQKCALIKPVVNGARVWLLIVGHGENAIETLDRFLAMR